MREQEKRDGLLLGDVMGRCAMGRIWDVEETPSPDETDDHGNPTVCVCCGREIEDFENSGDMCEDCYLRESRNQLYDRRHPDEY